MLIRGMVWRVIISWMFVLVSVRCASVEARLQVRDKLEPASVSGSSASLTEDGYQLVASLKNDAEMGSYIRRILANDGKQVRPGADSEVDGFVPYFSGTRSTQSLQQLRQQLRTVTWTRRASNLEVDMALDTLKSERVSSLSNASAYALAIAGALSSQDGSSRTRIFVEADLQSKPMKQLSEELAEAKESKAQVVFQREDGKVIVTSPRDMALQMMMRPLKRWTETLNAQRDQASKSLGQLPTEMLQGGHSLAPVDKPEPVATEDTEPQAKVHQRRKRNHRHRSS